MFDFVGFAIFYARLGGYYLGVADLRGGVGKDFIGDGLGKFGEREWECVS
jgi:hypothetical protein